LTSETIKRIDPRENVTLATTDPTTMGKPKTNNARTALRRLRNKGRLLDALRDADLATQRTLLRSASKDLVDTLVDAVKLIVHNQERLTESQYIALRRQARRISDVINPRSNLAKKRRTLQNGGFLNFVLPLLGGLLGIGK